VVAPGTVERPAVARPSEPAVPELPEVESVRRQLAPELTGRRVVAVWTDPHPQQRFSDVPLVEDRRIEAVRRRGKFLLCPLDDEGPAGELELVLHLGMTGSFRFAPADPARTPAVDATEHVRARFTLDDGRELRFRDPRRFGRVSVVPAGRYAERVPTLATLGPEPLSDDFDPDGFADALARTSATVKAALLGQRLVAGVGNIYADEALWRARIHPASRRVGRHRAHALHAAIREVLTASIEREGTTFRDYQMVNGESGRNADFLDAYGQGDLPCKRCGTPMRRSVVAQRGTTHCPSCQRA
jgi:formamidopyrimidine-DNA glycosylase